MVVLLINNYKSKAKVEKLHNIMDFLRHVCVCACVHAGLHLPDNEKVEVVLMFRKR